MRGDLTACAATQMVDDATATLVIAIRDASMNRIRISAPTRADADDKPGGPLQPCRVEILERQQAVGERGGFRRVPVRPVGLREHIVDEIDTARCYEAERTFQVGILSGPRVCINEVVRSRGACEKCTAVLKHEANARVGTKFLSRDRLI